MQLTAIEALASLFGLCGAFLLASRGRWASLGWLAFLASNVAWWIFAVRAGHQFLLLQQVGFTATSLLGIWRWILQPAVQWTEWRGDFHGNVTMQIAVLLRTKGGRRADLHRMVAPDAPGCFHTHPARAVRIVLWAGYVEELEDGSMRHWRPGMVGVVHPQLSHRIASLPRGRSYSLWIRGRKTHQTQLRGPGWEATGAQAGQPQGRSQ